MSVSNARLIAHSAVSMGILNGFEKNNVRQHQHFFHSILGARGVRECFFAKYSSVIWHLFIDTYLCVLNYFGDFHRSNIYFDRFSNKSGLIDFQLE